MTQTQPDNSHLAGQHAAAAGSVPAGLQIDTARTVDEVVAAWSLVYSAYRRTGLIDANPYGIHTTPQAVGPHTTVILGRMADLPVCTLSVMLDNPAGLPLDSVYRADLDRLRAKGRCLGELGLFADRREQLGRSLPALFEMMRHVFYMARYTPGNCAVIGVHPDHVAFYVRYFHFERFADDSVMPTVRNNPVVPLCLDLCAKARQQPLPRGLAYFVANPLSDEYLRHRFNFDPAVVGPSVIGQYLRYRTGLAQGRAAGPGPVLPAAGAPPT